MSSVPERFYDENGELVEDDAFFEWAFDTACAAALAANPGSRWVPASEVFANDPRRTPRPPAVVETARQENA